MQALPTQNSHCPWARLYPQAGHLPCICTNTVSLVQLELLRNGSASLQSTSSAWRSPFFQMLSPFGTADFSFLLNWWVELLLLYLFIFLWLLVLFLHLLFSHMGFPLLSINCLFMLFAHYSIESPLFFSCRCIRVSCIAKEQHCPIEIHCEPHT